MTTRIVDPESRIEQAFIRVVTIQDGTITGTIASRIQLVSGYRYGDRYSLPESDILDWLIAKPDGTEEGNFVGRFLDEYQKALSGE